MRGGCCRWAVQDVAKVLTYRVCYRYNVFGCKDDSKRGCFHRATGAQKYQPLMDRVDSVRLAPARVRRHTLPLLATLAA
eukprot:COSAG01_NODE_5132_length_4464_cov_3.665979_1_plen_79_part_00